ncbi:MAG: hypothetical protein ACOX6T_10460 [Myxococcales bacterium]|jgi:hypothetical protein
MPRRVLSPLLALGLAAGCGYTSTYVPPDDGRARVVWRDGSAVALVPAQSEACWREVQRASGTTQPLVADAAPAASVSHDVHVHLPIWVHVHHRHHHHLHPHAHLHHAHHAATAHSGAPDSGPHKAVSANAPSDSSSSVRSSNTDLRLLIVAATVALVSMPIVAIALALDEPERPVEAAAAADVVNAFNDLARVPGSACAATAEVTP